MSAGNRKNPYRPAPPPVKRSSSWSGYILILCLIIMLGMVLGMSLP